MQSVVWFKKDLRVTDAAPLFEAAKRGPLLPLYIYEPEQLAHAEFGGHHLTYLNECLSELEAALRSLGAPLVIRVGDAVSVLEGLRTEIGGYELWAHEETGNWQSYQRDRRVRAWAHAQGIAFHEFPNNGVLRGMKNRDGWAANWEARMTKPVVPSPVTLTPVALTPVTLEPTRGASQGIQSHAALGVAPNTKTLPPGGSRVARETLASFLEVRGVNYTREMSSPVTAETSCSRLSTVLAFGTLSMREIAQASRQRLANVRGARGAGEVVDGRWLQSLRSFESRLHWHCHFMQRLEGEPRMEFENLNRAMDGLRENDWNEDHFAAWATGRTGYPMVDACMRMVLETGWLNFRMRAMLVSFASQHLWLHWRKTGLHLAQHWLDNEPGIHWSQMQMQSSTVGINQVRIYNPTKQARDQDPSGNFIRRWLPELATVPTAFIHDPWQWLGFSSLEYPAPIVDEASAGRLAKSRIYVARQTQAFKAEAARVYAQHGSRKRPTRRVTKKPLETKPAPTKSTPTKPRPSAKTSHTSDIQSLFGPEFDVNPAESTGIGSNRVGPNTIKPKRPA
jgi:deoxyribodipyrimidine photo-lyase